MLFIPGNGDLQDTLLCQTLRHSGAGDEGLSYLRTFWGGWPDTSHPYRCLLFFTPSVWSLQTQLTVEKVPLLCDDQPGSHPEIKVMLSVPSLRRESPHELACLHVNEQGWSDTCAEPGLQGLGWCSADMGSCLPPTMDMGHSKPQRGTEGFRGTPADCP